MRNVKKNRLVTLICILMLLIITTTVCLVSCVKPKKVENVIINNYDITVTDGAAKFRYAAEKAIESAVHIKATFKSVSNYNYYKTISIISSGTIITDNGYILTNHHSLSYSGYSLDAVKITTFDKEYNETSYNAELVQAKSDYELDIAVLKISDAGSKKFVPATIGSSDELKMGENTFFLGESAGTGFMLSNAVIAHPKSTELVYLDEGFSALVKINANVNQGISISDTSTTLFRGGSNVYIGGGSGLYDIKGNFIGMVTYRKAGQDNQAENLVMGIGYAIRAEDIQAVLTEKYSNIVLTLPPSENNE